MSKHAKVHPRPSHARPVQPTPVNAHWMSRPQGPVGCTAGLEYLCRINELVLQQDLNVRCGADSIGYEISNASGQQLYTAVEDTPKGGCGVCFPGQRGYTVNIRDNLEHEVIRVKRDSLCCSCCPCLGCQHLVQIEAPVGNVIGYLKSRMGFCSISFDLTSPDDQVLFTMRFPCCATQKFFHDADFEIYSADGSEEVAKIIKNWSKHTRYYRLKKYTLSFPKDLDERMKALMLGTVFGLDALYYPPISYN